MPGVGGIGLGRRSNFYWKSKSAKTQNAPRTKFFWKFSKFLSLLFNAKGTHFEYSVVPVHCVYTGP